MNMKSYVEGFPAQMGEAEELGKAFKPGKKTPKINNVLICGLGGSGIGGGIAKDLVSDDCSVPITLCNDYDIPAFVDKHTLCIASSYSGNTEETLDAVKKADRKGATIVCITSGGKLLRTAKRKDYPYVEVPGGAPPRTALGYSLTQQLYILHAYGLTSNKSIRQLSKVEKFLNKNQSSIKKKAKALTAKIGNKMPVIYIVDGMEAVAIRWRQQLNENSKMLVWHNKIPEMNHNELVAWQADKRTEIIPIFISTDSDHVRSQMRSDLNLKVIKKKTDSYVTVKADGKNKTEQAFYLINLGDWLSVYLADLYEVDAMNIDVINDLKSNLSKK